MIEWQNPQFLWLLLLLPLFLWKKNLSCKIISFSSLSLLKKANQQYSSSSFFQKFPLPLILFLLLVFSLSQPKWQTKIIQKENLKTTVLLIDVSGSMNKKEKENSTFLEIAKSKAKNWLNSNPKSTTALMIFSSQAYLLVPPTQNHQWLHWQIQQIKPEKIKEKGTAIGEAILMAEKVLLRQKSKKKELLLFTDGIENIGNINFIKAWEKIKKTGIKGEIISLNSSNFTSSKKKKVSFSNNPKSIKFLPFLLFSSLLFSLLLWKKKRKNIYFIISFFLFLEIGRTQIYAFQAKKNFIFIFDLSQSSLVQDTLEKNRLETAKKIAKELLRKNDKKKFALIAFADYPYLFSPFTTDKTYLEQLIDSLDEETIPTKSSNVFEALILAKKTIISEPEKQAEILLFSDGEFFPSLPSKFSFSFKISPIGLGSQKGGFIPLPYNQEILKDKNENPIISKLNSNNLSLLAKKSKGNYFHYSQDEKMKKYFNQKSIHLPFVLLSLLLLCFNQAMHSQKIKIFCFFFFLTQSSFSSESNKGIYFYKEGNYEKALNYFSENLKKENSSMNQAKKHFNLGNTLFYFGKQIYEQKSSIKKCLLLWQESLNHYSQALQILPQDKAIQENTKQVQSLISMLIDDERKKQLINQKLPESIKTKIKNKKKSNQTSQQAKISSVESKEKKQIKTALRLLKQSSQILRKIQTRNESQNW